MSCTDDKYNYGNQGFGTSIYGTGASPYLDDEDELELYTVLKNALPEWLFEDCPQEIWYAYTKIYKVVKRNVVDQDLARTYITKAFGIWLDQHARDRGTYRQPFETDQALRTRLRTFQDTVNGNSMVFDGGLKFFDAYSGSSSFTATYEVIYKDKLDAYSIAGVSSYSGTTFNDGYHPKGIYFRSLGAGTYYLYRTATDGYGGTGLIGTTDGYSAYDGYGTPDGYGNILDEGLLFIDSGQTATTPLPNTSTYTIPQLGLVKQILNNGDGYGPYNCTGNYPGFVELPLDGMFLDDPFDGFISTGARLCNLSFMIIIILPYASVEGYPPAILNTVRVGVERIKGAGIVSFVEADNGTLPLLY